MKYFIKKTVKWFLFLALTVLFFSLPIILHDYDAEKVGQDSITAVAPSGGKSGVVLFEFVPPVAERIVSGNSTGLAMIIKTDSSEKAVYLYVNGEKQDMAVISDSMGIEFQSIYLKDGANEITAILRAAGGEVLAVRKMRIFSQKKL